MDNLITAQEVVELAFAENSNMREESISSTSIHIAEIKYLKPVFGNMYPMLGSTYAEYTNNYVKPALAYYVKCEIMSSTAIDMSNSGVAVANPQYQSAASDKQRQRLYDSEMSKAKVLLDDALAYIYAHIEEFPDFEGAIPKTHYRNGGLILGSGVSTRPTQVVSNPVSRQEFEALSKELKGKVDKIDGMGLSTNDYTDEDKELVVSLANKKESVGYIAITYNDLVELRNTSQLIAGAFYRITDFVTTSTQEDTRSVGNPFDVVVLALSSNELAEKAFAVHSERDRDGYFANNNLGAWELWYCLDNDITRFAWADTSDGKGVIYRMIDEFQNDCPYDFKNIQYLTTINRDSGYPIYDEDGYQEWVYTFCGASYDIDNREWSDYLKDGSLESPAGHMSDEAISSFRNNVMKPYIKINVYDEDRQKCGIAYLNRNIFFGYWETIGSTDEENFPYYYTYGCHHNILEDDCYENIFMYGCIKIHLRRGCAYNIFDNVTSYIQFGPFCTDNRVDACSLITLGQNCGYNTITGSRDITMGNECHNNTINQLINATFTSSIAKVTANNLANNFRQNVYFAINSQGQVVNFVIADLKNS